MRYKLRGVNNLIDPIPTIFENRGIEDYKRFLDLDESVTHHWSLLDNMSKAVELVIRHLDSNNNLFIQIDEDSDGHLSAAILYNYLKQIKPDVNITWRTHETKRHGIIPSTIPEDTDLVIVPDASSDEQGLHKEISDKGIDILVLDHHEAEQYSKYALVVNNQLSPNFPNKELSAAGIVYKFVQAMDDSLGLSFADKYLDLVAIANIADSMSTKELETRYYIQEGFKRINNPLIKEIMSKSSYIQNGELTIKDVSYTIAPIINANTRIGTIEDRRNMFKALTHQKLTHSKLKPRESINGIVRILSDIRETQNEMREKGEKFVNETIKKQGLDENKLIAVNVDGEIEPSLSGVIAIRIAQQYGKPVLILRNSEEDEGVLRGSARGYENGHLKDLKQYLTDTGKFILCAGHPNAHGVEILPDKLTEVVELINEDLKDVEIDTDTFEVDFITKVKELNLGLIHVLDKLRATWGKEVEEPLLAIEKVQVSRRDVEIIGKKQNVIKFSCNGVEYIKFNAQCSEIAELTRGKKSEIVIMNVVGGVGVNSFRGRRTPQVIIEGFDVTGIRQREVAF